MDAAQSGVVSGAKGTVKTQRPSSWKEVKELTLAELKSLCRELKLPLEGRKADFIDLVCGALDISKSGVAAGCEVKAECAVSNFDSNTHQQYEALGKLSIISGEWNRDLSCVPSSFGLDAIRTYLVDCPDKIFDVSARRSPCVHGA
eukprot:scpid29227/ scgid20884/ 